MIFNVLKFQSRTIAGGAIVVGVLSLASRLVGLLRDRILAGQFGAGDTLDVYYAAFRIPDAAFALLVVGALSASFIPIFAKYYTKTRFDEVGAWKFTSNVLNLLGLSFLVFAILGMIFASPLAELVAPGFGVSKQAHVADFMRVMFIAQFFLAISTVFGSVLQSTRRFVIFAIAPVLYNLGIIAGAIWLVEPFGAIGLAWGVVLGAVLHTAVSTFGVYSLGYRYKPYISLGDRDARQTLSLMLPRVFGLGVVQLQFIVLGIIASGLAAGSLAAFQLAYNIQYFPVGILGVSFAIAVFPALSEHVEDHEPQQFIDTFSNTVRQIFYFIIPATIIFLLLRAQIVRVILGSGTFSWTETILVADILAFFTLSFFAQAIIYVLVRGFFAYKDSVTPLIAGAVAIVVLIFASRSFTASYGVVGLSMAFSLASLIQVALLWAMLRIRTGSLGEAKIIPGLFKMTVAGALAALVIQYVGKDLALRVTSLDTFFGVFFQGLFAGLLGLAVYVLVTYLLRTEEYTMVKEGFDRRVLRRIKPQESPEGQS